MKSKNYIKLVSCFAAAAVLAGCATPRPYKPYQPYVAAKPARPAVTHQYVVTAVAADGKPLAGVAVNVELTSEHSAAQTAQCTTDDQGSCPVATIQVNVDPSMTYVSSYSSRAKVKGTKAGYYDANEAATSSHGSSTASSDAVSKLTLRMIRPVDYLEDGFATSSADKDLRERVLRFLDVIRVQSILNDATVMLKGVGTSEFKGRKYLRLRLASTTTYNTLKLDKYAIGKRLFDETVRQVLSPLNENIAAPKAYFGYDIVVYGLSKDFSEKYATPTKTEYRFLMPEAAVRKYKDKDISGQALLDASVQLLNDERIELKLQ